MNPPGSGRWTPLVTGDGSSTLVHPVHGQACHSRAGAWTEARERYATACRVRERALAFRDGGRGRFRLLDIGTGLGLNLAAALAALDGTGVVLDAVTLEIDPEVIETTLRLPPAPLSDLERVHAPVRTALARALAARRGERVDLRGGTLRLLVGDGRETLPALAEDARFDAVFLDPFSPRVDAALWEPAFLRAVAERMERGSLLSTYSVSLGVRAALAAAGLEVGSGARVGTKAGGTLSARECVLPPLDPRTARRVAARAGLLRSRGGEIRYQDGLPSRP